MDMRRNKREGFALAVAIGAMVVIGALIAGAFFASTQEFRVGRNSLVGQRAFAVAEYGLNYEISNWDRSRNLPPPGGLPVGVIDDDQVQVANGDTAYVKVTRLNENTFWVVSEGRADLGTKETTARRRTNMMVRIAYPSVKVGGAVVVGGNLGLNGASIVDGTDAVPTDWGSQCDSLRGADTAAVEVGATGTVTGADTVGGGQNLLGPYKLIRDPAAADSNTYIRYGTETWNSLVANADIRIHTDPIPMPFGTDSTCDVSGANQIRNWGEPYRSSHGTYTYIPGCRFYFPIIYADTNLTLNANGRGQGILLVNGSLTVNGTFDFDGLIILRDDLKGSGTANVTGSIMARDINNSNGGSIVTGVINVHYSKCAIESALRASAILTQVKDRGWAQLF